MIQQRSSLNDVIPYSTLEFSRQLSRTSPPKFKAVLGMLREVAMTSFKDGDEYVLHAVLMLAQRGGTERRVYLEWFDALCSHQVCDCVCVRLAIRTQCGGMRASVRLHAIIMNSMTCWL